MYTKTCTDSQIQLARLDGRVLFFNVWGNTACMGEHYSLGPRQRKGKKYFFDPARSIGEKNSM